ncbi:hypothetical protein [Solirubrum puertoriconensis]|uniref:Uncharacterized protein n=1 Tax=Solirubrum puertoriconensis TaxID=1751427 RepID=A0A9X0HLD0_SOLP1|nr:hypothetical protein [Solirubrum puertoriconensis]KUG08121.1 hypothetical protein ASU33_07950 [Solirubrum puertoriconensis]
MTPNESVRAWKHALMATGAFCLLILFVSLSAPVKDAGRAGVLGTRLLIIGFWTLQFIYLGTAAGVLVFVMRALARLRIMWVLMWIPYAMLGYNLFPAMRAYEPVFIAPLYLAVPFFIVLHGLLFAIRTRANNQFSDGN